MQRKTKQRGEEEVGLEVKYRGGLLFSLSVVSDSVWPHWLQHARLPCPSPSPGVCSNSCPCQPTISSSVVLFSCLQSFPGSGRKLLFYNKGFEDNLSSLVTERGKGAKCSPEKEHFMQGNSDQRPWGRNVLPVSKEASGVGVTEGRRERLEVREKWKSRSCRTLEASEGRLSFPASERGSHWCFVQRNDMIWLLF